MHIQRFKQESIIKKDSKAKTIEVNRSILGSLIAVSTRTGQVIDFKKALTYPLSSVPLSLANPDGTRRSTAKSKLQSIILDQSSVQISHPRKNSPDKSTVSAFLIDMMASIRTLKEIPDTYELLTWKFIRSIPSGYDRIDIIADTYREVSIKTAERNKRGESQRIMIQSEQSKIPRNFQEFLKNGENKRRMITLIFNVIAKDRIKALDLLHCNEILLSSDNICTRVTDLTATEEETLTSDQQEADTKLILYCLHALSKDENKKVIVRSPSADIDVFVILLAKVESQHRVFLDFGVGMHRKGMYLHDIEMGTDQKKCLVGFHAFTGNDYISSFFQKGKGQCWRVVEKNRKFVTTFMRLGLMWDLTDQIFQELEEYVCRLYGCRLRNIDDARHNIFEKKINKDGKVIDMALLPPCQSSLKLHSQRANVIAKIWNSADQRTCELPALSNLGWTEDLQIKWIHFPFPAEVEEIFFDAEDDAFYGEEEESDEEDETD